ncbi:MAG TPA: inositol monophosphatase family protein [Oceanobacillus sp.]|nr:inositol monophosphatase family protein [Oceanobacillus sp.]
MDLQSIRATAENIAVHAGETVMPFFNQPHQETIKTNIYDVVTEGDKAAEAVIIPALQEAFPQHGIVSEEGGGGLVAASEAEYSWYIDPIDGTTNFANNIPFFAISIALADRALNPLVGVVYNPVSRELYSAAKGFGATLNGNPIRVTQNDALNRAVLSTGFSYERHTQEDNNLRAWEAMLMAARDLRRFGAAALDLCFVAAGRLDGFWERYIHSWDCLAGILCVLEAGGKATDYSGGTSKLLTGDEIVATNGLLHEDVLRVLHS